MGHVCADLTPADDRLDELGSDIAGHGQALPTKVESATVRVGRARVDAVTDGLTGLHNQRYFKQRLGEEVAGATVIASATRPATTPCAVSGVLLRSVRQVDLAARYDGEKFAVILMDTTSDGALEVAERIRAGVAGLGLAGPERGLIVSVGVTTFPDHDARTEELVDNADWAMYLAKRQGRDRVMPFGPGAHEPPSGTPATKYTGAHPSGRRCDLPSWLESLHSFPPPGQRKECA